MAIYKKNNDIWENIEYLYVKNNGVWKDISKAYTKRSGVWRNIFNKEYTVEDIGPGEPIYKVANKEAVYVVKIHWTNIFYRTAYNNSTIFDNDVINLKFLLNNLINNGYKITVYYFIYGMGEVEEIASWLLELYNSDPDEQYLTGYTYYNQIAINIQEQIQEYIVDSYFTKTAPLVTTLNSYFYSECINKETFLNGIQNKTEEETGLNNSCIPQLYIVNMDLYKMSYGAPYYLPFMTTSAYSEVYNYKLFTDLLKSWYHFDINLRNTFQSTKFKKIKDIISFPFISNIKIFDNGYDNLWEKYIFPKNTKSLSGTTTIGISENFQSSSFLNYWQSLDTITTNDFNTSNINDLFNLNSSGGNLQGPLNNTIYSVSLMGAIHSNVLAINNLFTNDIIYFPPYGGRLFVTNVNYWYSDIISSINFNKNYYDYSNVRPLSNVIYMLQQLPLVSEPLDF